MDVTAPFSFVHFFLLLFFFVQRYTFLSSSIQVQLKEYDQQQLALKEKRLNDQGAGEKDATSSTTPTTTTAKPHQSPVKLCSSPVKSVAVGGHGERSGSAGDSPRQQFQSPDSSSSSSATQVGDDDDDDDDNNDVMIVVMMMMTTMTTSTMTAMS
jgi:hypothetical protein